MVSYLAHPQIRLCANTMRLGGCIAYPTEGVWGLGCDPEDALAVQRILLLKQRPVEKGLILVSASIEDFSTIIDGLAPSIIAKMHASWPGPTTWVVPHNGLVPAHISGGRNSVAIRVSAHPVVAGLSKAFGGPLVSTSANPTGRPAATSNMKVRQYFNNAGLSFAPGTVASPGEASQIIHALTGETLRV